MVDYIFNWLPFGSATGTICFIESHTSEIAVKPRAGHHCPPLRDLGCGIYIAVGKVKAPAGQALDICLRSAELRHS